MCDICTLSYEDKCIHVHFRIRTKNVIFDFLVNATYDTIVLNFPTITSNQVVWAIAHNKYIISKMKQPLLAHYWQQNDIFYNKCMHVH